MLSRVRFATGRLVSRAFSICFAISICFTLALPAAEPISKSALLKALRSHITSSKELAGYVDTRGVDFALTPDVEAELKAAGATPELIEAIRSHSKAVTSIPSGPASNTSSVTPAVKKTAPTTLNLAAGVYRKDGDDWIKVLDEGIKWKKSGALHKFTVGLGKTELVGTVAGSSSPNLLHDPVVFVISVPDGAQIGQYLLIQLKPKKGSREINVAPSGEEGKALVPFSSKRLSKNLFEIDFAQGAGDYGFLPPGKDMADGEMEPANRMYTFRVLQ